MKPPRVLFLLVSLALIGASLAPVVQADVVHLRTGEAVKGRPIQERSSEAYLTVEDYLSGAFRRLAWDALDPGDRDRIQEEWGWTRTGQSTVVGALIVIKLGDGSTAEIRGVVVRENEQKLVVQFDGREVDVEKSRIVSRDEEELDVREIWAPEQLTERYKGERKQEGVDFSNPDSVQARDWFQLGVYAEWVGDYDAARGAYERASQDEEFLKKDLAAARLERVDILLQDKAALDTLRDARRKLRMNLFRKVREIADTFTTEHPNASESVLAKLEDLRVEFAERRTDEFQKLARRNFVDIVEDLIHKKLKDDDKLAITDMTSWTRRELPELAFITLAGKEVDEEGNPTDQGTRKFLDALDDVTPEEAKAFWEGRWEGRRRGSWKRVTYGDGTFIVDPPKIKPPKNRRGGGGGGRGGGGGGNVEIPKPPTRDQWWERTNRKERERWVLAYFVERSELFELADPEFRPCNLCHGVGLLTKVLQTGDTLAYLCTQCAGARQDKIVKYR